MNKLEFLRRRAMEQYNNNDIESALKTGEVLLREHWHINNLFTIGYADDLYNLACMYDETDNLERAAQLYSESARQISAARGEGLSFAVRLSSLALVLSRMGIPEPAYFMHGHVTEIRRRELGRRDPLYADSLYNLANAAADLGQMKDALRHHLSALNVREIVGETSDIIDSLHSIAFIYESVGDYKKAASYAETAVELADGDEAAYASACNYLAGLYENCEDYENALNLYDQVLEITTGSVGREHSAYLNVAYRRANLLTRMARMTDALNSHEEVKELFKNLVGTNHIFYANCLRSMAIINKELGEPHAAEALMLESMKIRRAASDDIMSDIIFLIRLYLGGRQDEKALEALIYALMCSDSKTPEFSALLASLAETLSLPDGGAGFIQAMEALNDRSKLRPIIDKWERWENQHGSD